MNKLTTVIFDFDGVTVCTEDVFASFDCDLINAWLGKLGIDHSLTFSDVRQLAGRSGPDKFIKIGILLGEDFNPRLEEFTTERDEKRKTLFADYPVPLGKNLKALLDVLGKKHSAIATNKHRFKLKRDMRLMGYSDLFEVMVTSDPPMKRKPEPDMLLEAMKRLGVIPEETAYIGDNPGDMIAAKAARVTPIGFVTDGIDNDPKRTKDLKDAGAVLVIDDFKNLIPYIKE